MKHIKIMVFAIALAGIMASLSIAYAQQDKNAAQAPPQRGPHGQRGGPDGPCGPPPDGRQGGFRRGPFSQLDLSDEQRAQVDSLMDATRESSRTQSEKVRALDKQIHALVDSGSFDEAKVSALINAKAPLLAELEIMHLRTDAAIYNLLTAEQKAQFSKQRKEHRPPPPGPNFGPGDGPGRPDNEN